METPGVSGNTLDVCCEHGKPLEWPFFVRDALRLSVAALCSGREGQDLGLPLVHVLGKKLQTGRGYVVRFSGISKNIITDKGLDFRKGIKMLICKNKRGMRQDGCTLFCVSHICQGTSALGCLK